MSTSFFVAADWLAEHIDDPEIQIIDARMAPAGQEAPARYGRGIPRRPRAERAVFRY